MDQEFQYFVLLISVLLVPKILLRFRIPSGLTAMALGVLTTVCLGWFHESQLLLMLATLGITSLFLFAGLEVDYYELKQDLTVILKHSITTFLIFAVVSYLLTLALDLPLRPAILLSLGLLTPSTGFILNSLSSFKFTDEQKYWIRSKAIASEILAIFVMFMVLQSESIKTLGLSSIAIVAMILIVPFLFRFFLKIIAPFAPNSEVTFLILLAFVCGVATRKMGTYYLVGAFIVGIVAAQFRHFVKTDNSDKMFYAIGFFSTLFVPFYFFRAGIGLGSSTITWTGISVGLAFSAIFIPLRYFSILASIKVFLNNYWEDRQEISVSLMPTLIFGLVIASILQERFSISPDITIGLIIYTLVSSIVPALLLEKSSPEEYDAAFILSSPSKEQ